MHTVDDSLLAQYRGIRVLVLGASGFIGRWVARALTRCQSQVCLGVRNPKFASKIFAQYGVPGQMFEVDLNCPDDIRKCIAEVKPSITFNLAGYGIDKLERDETRLELINHELVRTVCEAITLSSDVDWIGQRLIHTGSALEYGDVGGTLSEDTVPNPTTAYGRSKLAGTQSVSRFCTSNSMKGLTARLFTVYGPGEHEGRLLPSLLRTAKSGEPLGLTNGLQRRDFTYVADVAEGLLRLGLASAKPGDVVNLATGRLTPVRTFVETAAGVLKIPMENLRFGALPTRADEMQLAGIRVDYLSQLTGWKPPTGIAEGIGHTAEFHVDHGELPEGSL